MIYKVYIKTPYHLLAALNSDHNLTHFFINNYSTCRVSCGPAQTFNKTVLHNSIQMFDEQSTQLIT